MRRSLKVGAPLSLSGRFAIQGQQARRGLALWAEDVNRAGRLTISSGDDLTPIDLVVIDDGSTRAGATSATERLILQDRVDLLFSPYSSVLTIAAAEVAEQHGRVLWNHGGSSDALEERGYRHIVTLLSPASRYFEPVLEMAAAQPGIGSHACRRVVLLHGKRGTFPAAVADGAERCAAGLGFEVVLRAPYPDPADLPVLLLRIASLQPDIVLGVGTTEADLAFAREARREGLSAPVMALIAAPIEHFGETLGDEANGFCGPSQWEPTLRDSPGIGPTSAAFAASFRARFGVEADYPAAQAYAAGLIAAECVRRAGSLSDDALLEAARTLDLTTFYGRFRLDPATGQQVGHQIVVVQWQAGGKQIVWPPAAATSAYQLRAPTAAPTPAPSDTPS